MYFSYLITFLILAMCGKELILGRFITGKFVKLDLSTRIIYTNFFQKTIEINNKIFNLSIVDTAGEEKYHALTPIFYRDCKGVVIIFDITNKNTFKRVTKWFHEVKDFAEKDTQILLVGNNIDLPDREVTKDEATKLAQEYNCNYLEVSANLGTNINEIFYSLTSSIYQALKNSKNEKIEYNEENNKNYRSNKSKKLKIEEEQNINKNLKKRKFLGNERHNINKSDEFKKEIFQEFQGKKWFRKNLKYINF